MNINATLLIQAINFWIAYCILRFMVLKPAYAVIKHKRTSVKSLEDAIEAIDMREQALKEQRYTIWYANHILFLRKAPNLNNEPSIPLSTIKHDQIETSHVSKQSIEEVHDYIVERLKGCE